MFERFTDRARKVMALANQEAQRFNHEQVGTEHILLGIIKEGSGVGAAVLKTLNTDLCKVRREVEKLVKSGPETVVMVGRLPQTPRCKRVLEFAIEEARDLNHNYVGTEHLLLALCRETDGLCFKVLSNLKITSDSLIEGVKALLGEETVSAEIEPKLLSQSAVRTLQKIADREVLAPFSFRFVDRDQSYELLDPTGQVVQSKSFSGPVGDYIYNALRKHEASQKLLRDCQEHLESLDPDRLLAVALSDGIKAAYCELKRRIELLLDS